MARDSPRLSRHHFSVIPCNQHVKSRTKHGTRDRWGPRVGRFCKRRGYIVLGGTDAAHFFCRWEDGCCIENSYLKTSVLLNPGNNTVPLPPPSPSPHHSRRPPSSTLTVPCWKWKRLDVQVALPPIHVIGVIIVISRSLLLCSRKDINGIIQTKRS